MPRIPITDKLIDFVAKVMKVHKDIAEGSIVMWQEGKGHIPEKIAVKFPRLAILWKSESVRAAVAGKVTLETISDEQLNSIPE